VSERCYTTSSAFLEALAEAGIGYIFANLGSDHPASSRPRRKPRPKAATASCPH
jgi:acetolactate synthase-1/2/3 large subunit